MGILTVLLLVFFVIIAILLILFVLVQNEEGDSLGGLFAGGSGSAFGSRSGNVLTRITTVLGTLFLVVSLGLALLSRTPSESGVEEAGREQALEDSRRGEGYLRSSTTETQEEEFDMGEFFNMMEGDINFQDYFDIIEQVNSEDQ